MSQKWQSCSLKKLGLWCSDGNICKVLYMLSSLQCICYGQIILPLQTQLSHHYIPHSKVVTHWDSEERNSINKAALVCHGIKSYALLSIEVIRTITWADFGLYAEVIEWHAFPDRLFTPEWTWPVNGNRRSSEWGTGLCFYSGRRAGLQEWQLQMVYKPCEGMRLLFISLGSTCLQREN